jgi:hypothetical protein
MGEPFKTASTRIEVRPTGISKTTGGRTSCLPPNPTRTVACGHAARSAREVMVKVFEELTERDHTFLKRFAALPKHGRKRRYLSRTKEDLYPGRPHLVVNAYELPNSIRVGGATRTRAGRA